LENVIAFSEAILKLTAVTYPLIEASVDDTLREQLLLGIESNIRSSIQCRILTVLAIADAGLNNPEVNHALLTFILRIFGVQISFFLESVWENCVSLRMM